MRVSKSTFYANGGLSNPKLYRKANAKEDCCGREFIGKIEVLND